MKYLLCNEKEPFVAITRELIAETPLMLGIEPFIGTLQLDLKIEALEKFQALCFYHPLSMVFYSHCKEEIPPETYFTILKREHDYLACFALSHRDLTTTLSSSFSVHIQSGQSREANKTRPFLILVQGETIHEVIQQLLATTLEQTGNVGKLLRQKSSLSSCFERLGWLSKLAFGKDVSHQKVIDSIQSLKNEGFSVGFVVLEEGWQRLAPVARGNLSLYDFEADPQRFPLGLKGIVNELKKLDVEQVGVWHGIMGYRGGLHSRLAQTYDFPPDSQGRYFPGYDLGRTFQFFYDYYAFLKDQGIKFVKVGDQISASFYCRQGMDVTRLYKNLQTAIQGASSLHFHSAQLNTECMRNENLLYWTNSSVASCNVSEDLFSSKTLASTIRHQLTHTLWLQHLMQPDFEAWSAQQESSETLAIFHALSGTFHAISERPGNHNVALLRKCVLPSGIVIKADKPLTLCEDCIFCDPVQESTIYKAYTFKGKNGILAAFHLAEPKKELSGKISSNDLPGLGGEKFALFSYRKGFIGTVNANDTFTLTLTEGKSDILTFAPIELGIAVLGCVGFFLPAGAITEVNVEEADVHISTVISAPLLIYCEKQILEIRCNGHVVPWTHERGSRLLTIEPRVSLLESPSCFAITFE